MLVIYICAAIRYKQRKALIIRSQWAAIPNISPKQIFFPLRKIRQKEKKEIDDEDKDDV